METISAMERRKQSQMILVHDAVFYSLLAQTREYKKLCRGELNDFIVVSRKDLKDLLDDIRKPRIWHGFNPTIQFA